MNCAAAVLPTNCLGVLHTEFNSCSKATVPN